MKKIYYLLAAFAVMSFASCTDDDDELLVGGDIDIVTPMPENKPNEEVDAAIFPLLNLDYPGLEKVKAHYEADELYYAAYELLQYYKTRTNVIDPAMTLINVTASDGEKTMADDAMDNYRFYVKGFTDKEGRPYSVKKDGAINWKNNPSGVTNEYQKQLHRHQWFIAQGKMYRITGDEKYFESWKEVYSDWVAQNPKDESLQENKEGAWWQLQISARLTDQTKLLEYFKTAQGFTPEYLTLFLKSFAEQADYLSQEENFYKDGNILLSQGNALTNAGLLMPEFKNAQDWAAAGYGILNREVKKQFLPDGWHAEMSLHYHVGCVAYFYDALRLANANNAAHLMGSDVTSTLLKAAEVVMNFTYPNYFQKGTDNIVPMFNESFSQTRNVRKNNFKSYMDMFPDNREFLYMYTGHNGGTPTGTCPDTKLKLYPDAGYYVMRNGWTPQSTVMMLSNNHHNEISPAFSIWSHNTPDNGTFELYINGRNFFPDSGVFRYTAGDGGSAENKDRIWFRNTGVHNTLTKKNMEHPDKDYKLNITKGNGKLLASEEGTTEMLVFENQGYDDLKHRRAVFFVNKEFFVMVDEAIGSATNSLYLSYNLLPGTDSEVVIDTDEMGCHTAFNNGNNILVRSFAEAGKTIKVKKQEGRLSYSTSDKEWTKRPAYSIYLADKAANENPRFITVILPVASATGKTIAAEFTDGGWSDKGASLKVTVDGKEYPLAYKIN